MGTGGYNEVKVVTLTRQVQQRQAGRGTRPGQARDGGQGLMSVLHPLVALLLACIGLVGLWLVAWGIWSAVRRWLSTIFDL